MALMRWSYQLIPNVVQYVWTSEVFLLESLIDWSTGSTDRRLLTVRMHRQLKKDIQANGAQNMNYITRPL